MLFFMVKMMPKLPSKTKQNKRTHPVFNVSSDTAGLAIAMVNLKVKIGRKIVE